MLLATWRKKSNKKQKDVASVIGVSISQYSKIERGATFVSPQTAEKIKRLTKNAVTPNDLHRAWQAFRDGGVAS